MSHVELDSRVDMTSFRRLKDGPARAKEHALDAMLSQAGLLAPPPIQTTSLQTTI